MDIQKIKECFIEAKKHEEKGKKHKGLLIAKKDDKKAEEYVKKAKANLEICELYKEKRLDYKIPEEWFYTMYYCALAILAKFGVENRSQRCTALFLRFAKDAGLIEYEDEFIDRITVYSEKGAISDVDERESARYGSSVRSEEIMERYGTMTNLCRKCISQCEEIVFSDKNFEVPEDLLE